jgi:hypothetical protein
MSCRPAALQAAIIASQRSTDTSIGFSHSTCLPARAAAIVCSACSAFGVTTQTMSMSGLSAIRSIVR